MTLTSPAFADGEAIPRKYGRDFENVNPPLELRDPPPGTRSFVLIMEDPDVPPQAGVPVWDHWVLFDLSPELRSVPAGWTVEGKRGANTRGSLEYGGPRPPDREHRYFFHLLALDAMLNLPEGVTKPSLLEATNGHVLAEARLMGTFAP